MLVDFGDLKKDLKELADSMDHTLIYEENTLRPKNPGSTERRRISSGEGSLSPYSREFFRVFFQKNERKKVIL